MFSKCWKNLKLGKSKLKLDFKLLPKIFFRCNNIHREIDQWNRRRFGTKWHVTVPNSVTPNKPIVCKWIYMSQEWYCQMTQVARILNFHPHFRKTVISGNFYQILDEKCSFFVAWHNKSWTYHMKPAYFDQCSVCSMWLYFSQGIT